MSCTANPHFHLQFNSKVKLYLLTQDNLNLISPRGEVICFIKNNRNSGADIRVRVGRVIVQIPIEQTSIRTIVPVTTKLSDGQP